MRPLIRKILESACLVEHPPVLVDIGASGGLPPAWRVLAPYSIGVGFDADVRDFDPQGRAAKGWKRLHLLNHLVVAEPGTEVDFHFTASPHCSSTLQSNAEALRPWAFRDLFRIDRTVRLPAIDLPNALATAGVNRIDWFKCDSQGTDLRLFKSLSPTVQAQVLAADFEPGIIDAYHGEDKLHALMAYMDRLPFWVSNMTVKGSQRLGDLESSTMGSGERAFPQFFYRTAPGWCEISYLNKCESADLTERDLLLALVFALVHGQDGFAAHLAQAGQRRFGNELFAQVERSIRRRARWRGQVGLAIDRARGVVRRITA